MPAEAKRHGVKESDVLIAFPVDAKLQPILRARTTFNFLPIRSYGLPFILQGDFMLSANREDILEDNKWNDALVASTIELFLSSVDSFNVQELAKYTWPRYARSQGNAYGTIFQSFFSNLVNPLRSRCVLESQALVLAAPASLELVPAQFTDGARPPKPLLMGRTGLAGYVSTAYAPSDLSDLRISQQTCDSFCKLLWNETTNNQAVFQTKPADWHSRLAEVLLGIPVPRVKNIQLIPLQDGRWISSEQVPFYFANISDGLTVPSGIEIATISEAAGQEPSRRRLFERLGAQMLNSTQVSEQILQQHRNYKSRTWTADDVVKHAWFIFNASSRQQRTFSLSDLKTVTRDFKLFPANELYMDVPGSSFRISDLLGDGSSTVIRFFHDSYLKCGDQETAPSWYRWLQQELGVNTLPKLINSSGSTIREEFRSLVETKPSSLWLCLLKENWAHYSSPLKSTAARSFLAESLVDCIDGPPRKLRDTYLETANVTGEPLAAGIVPMVAVEYPQEPAWLRLSQLGLGTTRDLQFWLTILRRLPDLMQSTPTVADIERVYLKVQEWGAGNRQLIK
ncbi:hypothetical protein LTR85_002096 [Meristemomyces frigidus]|nr:hypothetical protein LTR85_002096 [Meristemomyces frigidus]